MQTVLIVVHLMVVLALIVFVLLQRSEGGGLGMGGGGAGNFLTSRGTTNALSRTTAILAGIFFVTSLGLSILAGMERGPRTILPGSTPGAPGGPTQPLGTGSGGVLDQLRPPAPPSGPEVPQSR
jgi:preprotein translocase subunit SecG